MYVAAYHSMHLHCFLAECLHECLNGGICSAPNVCNCSGTGYMDDRCQARTLQIILYNNIIVADFTHAVII